MTHHWLSVGCSCLCMLLGLTAIIIALVHGLGNVSGLDGEFIGNAPVIIPDDDSSAFTDGDDSSSSVTTGTSDESGTIGGPISGEFFMTLSMWLFWEGVVMTAGFLLVIVSMFVGGPKGYSRAVGRWILAFGEFMIMFGWIFWAIIGLVMLTRRYTSIPGISSDDAVYVASWVLIALIFFVWLVLFVYGSMAIAEIQEAIGAIYNALKKSVASFLPQLSPEQQALVDSVAMGTGSELGGYQVLPSEAVTESDARRKGL